jgi:hypothetical protein
MKYIARGIENDDQYCYLSSHEFMDDGSNVDLKIRIEKETVFFVQKMKFFIKPFIL